jgi:hypothetical protein
VFAIYEPNLLRSNAINDPDESDGAIQP